MVTGTLWAPGGTWPCLRGSILQATWGFLGEIGNKIGKIQPRSAIQLSFHIRGTENTMFCNSLQNEWESLKHVNRGGQENTTQNSGKGGENAVLSAHSLHLQEDSSWKGKIGFVCAGEGDIPKLHCFRIYFYDWL